jgi:hypothetical protein
MRNQALPVWPPTQVSFARSGRVSAARRRARPASLSQPVGAALGTQAGPARIRAVVEEAGFTRFRLAAQTPFNNVYEVRV